MATQTAAFNPTNGQPLYVGQTVTFEGRTYTGSTPVKTTSTTSTAPKTSTSTAPTSTSTPKPTGISSINTTLTVGSQGDQVKALQQYLAGLGYTNADGTPLKTDGIYGPNTKTAVMQFQSKNGLTADGIFGPKSLAGAQNLASTSTHEGTGTNGNTVTYNGQSYTTSSPQDAQFLNSAILPFLQQMQSSGMKINPDLTLSPDIISQILEKAKATVHPQYAQQIAGIQQDLARNVGNSTDAYNRSIEGEQQNFTKNLGDLRNTDANNGLAYSGFRGQDEGNLQSSENRNLASLSSQYGNTIGDYARNAEQQLGTAGMNGYQLPGLGNYSASLSGNGTFNQNGNVNTNYTPGTYRLGSVPLAENAAALALRNQNVDQASANKAAGLSYSDLYK